MLRTFVFTIALLLIAGTAALAQTSAKPPQAANPLELGTKEERAACAQDAVKYCGELIKDDAQPDVFAITSCMQANRQKLSAACRQVLDNRPQ